MTPYAAILGARFRVLLQYRAAALAGIGTQLFWGLIRLMIFDAFYRSATQTSVQPMSLPQAITYIWLGQAMLGILPWNVDPDVRNMIRTGSVAYELLRPVDLYSLWYSRAIAQRTAPTILKSVPLFIVAGLFFGMQMPQTLGALIGWMAATIGAVLLSAAITTLLTISLLWTLGGDGIVRLAPSLILALSGMLIPVQFFPDWSHRLLEFLPFAGLVDTPFRVYLGTLQGVDAVAAIGRQLIWTLVFVLMGRVALSRASRRLVVQGG